MSRVTHRDRARIVQLRGLGYSQKEVAEEIGVSRQTVSYHLGKFRSRAREDGANDVFCDIVMGSPEIYHSIVGPAFLKIAKSVEKSD